MPPPIKFWPKVSLKKRVIADKLNLRQKCLNQIWTVWFIDGTLVIFEKNTQMFENFITHLPYLGQKRVLHQSNVPPQKLCAPNHGGRGCNINKGPGSLPPSTNVFHTTFKIWFRESHAQHLYTNSNWYFEILNINHQHLQGIWSTEPSQYSSQASYQLPLRCWHSGSPH